MFESLRDWCTVPVRIKRRKAVAASGDVSYNDPVTVNGYVVTEIKDIIDKNGVRDVSTSYVYFPEDVAVTQDDMLQTFETDQMREIKKIGAFYDGNTGNVDVWVVYL